MVHQGAAQWNPWRYLRQHHPDIRVHEVELEPGYLGCLDHFKQIIWLDTRLTVAEQRCTIAHELGHLELDAVVGDWVTPAPEDRVDAWASRLLVPITPLVWAFGASLHLDEIAEELFVDPKTLRARLRNLSDEEQDMVMRAIVRWSAA